MNIATFEELIQIEAEEIAANLCGTEFFDLSPLEKLRARDRAIDLLVPAEIRLGLVPAA